MNINPWLVWKPTTRGWASSVVLAAPSREHVMSTDSWLVCKVTTRGCVSNIVPAVSSRGRDVH